MMNPTEHIDAALRILNTQRTISNRVQALKDHDSELMRKIMLYAYSPYIKFGIKINPTIAANLHTIAGNSGQLGIEDETVWKVLDSFAKSTKSSVEKLAMLQRLAAMCSPMTMQIVIGILEKSVVTGLAASTVNKAYPGLITVFNVQLAQKYADKKIRSFPQYVEVKYDGLRGIAIIPPTGLNDITVTTRTGRDIPAASYFHDELAYIGQAYHALRLEADPDFVYTGCVVDGELIGESFNDAVSTFRSNEKASAGTYMMFDILPMEALSEENFESDTFEARRSLLTKVVSKANELITAAGGPPLGATKISQSIAYSVSSKGEIWNMYNHARGEGREGLIVKSPTGRWQRKRSNDWLKMKAEETEDLQVIGAFEGKGEMVGTLGGIIVNRDGVEVRVGSGFTEQARAKLWSMFLRDLKRHDAGVDDPDQFELIGALTEVQFQEVTPDGSLRHPVFVRLRRDKNEVSF